MAAALAAGETPSPDLSRGGRSSGGHAAAAGPALSGRYRGLSGRGDAARIPHRLDLPGGHGTSARSARGEKPGLARALGYKAKPAGVAHRFEYDQRLHAVRRKNRQIGHPLGTPPGRQPAAGDFLLVSRKPSSAGAGRVWCRLGFTQRSAAHRLGDGFGDTRSARPSGRVRRRAAASGKSIGRGAAARLEAFVRRRGAGYVAILSRHAAVDAAGHLRRARRVDRSVLQRTAQPRARGGRRLAREAHLLSDRRAMDTPGRACRASS